MRFGYSVREPADTSPDDGGGPIRRSPLVTTRSGDGMPPNGWPQMVLRTPHQVVYDAEPGGAAYPGLQYMKFLPDGRLVRAGALGGGFAGALGYGGLGVDIPDPQTAFEQAVARAQQALDVARTWGLVGVGGFGALVGGAILGPSGHRLRTGILAAAAYAGGVWLARYIVMGAAGAAAKTSFLTPTTPSTTTTPTTPTTPTST